MEIVLITILSILLLVTSYVIYNLLRKVELLEDTIEIYQNRFRNTYDKMKDIDSTGAFESDDEVGSIFSGIREVLEETEQIFNSEFRE